MSWVSRSRKRYKPIRSWEIWLFVFIEEQGYMQSTGIRVGYVTDVLKDIRKR